MVTETTHTESLYADSIIIASNRGPIEYFLNQDSTLTHRRGPGGMVTALLSMGSHRESTWVALAMTEGDRFVFSRAQKDGDGSLPSPMDNKKMRLRYVVAPKDIFSRYRRISTELLWSIQHYMYPQTEELDAYFDITDYWMDGYSIINQLIADAICSEITRRNERTVVMLHDADFLLAAPMIRQRHPSILIQQFLHLPWPDIRYWHFLPSEIIQSIYTGLVGNDIVGFQTERDAHNFLDGARSVLEGSDVDWGTSSIWWRGHCTQVRTYPISISVVEERMIAQSAEGKEEVEKLRSLLSKKVIMRVDRIDPAKNIIRGFHAYARMLDEHEEMRGEVHFLAFLVPSREDIPAYTRHKAQVLKMIEEINQKYGTDGWQPIHLFLGNHRVRALAALQFYDVLLVNSIFDGMNLVAKEGVVVNQRNGLLVLSRTAGVFSQLGKAAIPISPTHIAETAKALYYALTLPIEERSVLAQLALKEVEQYNVNNWITLQIRDINGLLIEAH